MAAFLPVIYSNIWIPFKRDESETRCKSNYIKSVGSLLLLPFPCLLLSISVSLSLFFSTFLFRLQISIEISRKTVTIQVSRRKRRNIRCYKYRLKERMWSDEFILVPGYANTERVATKRIDNTTVGFMNNNLAAARFKGKKIAITLGQFCLSEFLRYLNLRAAGNYVEIKALFSR